MFNIHYASIILYYPIVILKENGVEMSINKCSSDYKISYSTCLAL